MIKLILSGRATTTRPRKDAMAHLQSVHGPMVYNAPADAGAMPSIYVQNHVVPISPLPSSLGDWAWDRDLVTEISFEDLGHLKASTATPYYLENLRPDEGRFVDQATVRPLIVTEQRIGSVDTDAVFKLFIYLKASHDIEAFERQWQRAVEIASDVCVRQAMNRPVRSPGTPPIFVDGVWALWFDDSDQADAFIATHLEPLLKGFGNHIDPFGGYVLKAEEYSVARLRIENATPSQQRLSA